MSGLPTVGRLRELIAQLPDDMPIRPATDQTWDDHEPGVQLEGFRVDRGTLEVVVSLFYLNEDEEDDEDEDDDDGEDEDGPDLDLCDQCMRSRVPIARTNRKGETICEDCDKDYDELHPGEFDEEE